MSFDRMIDSSNELLGALNLRGAAKPGVPAESDARRFLVKTLRELRHAVALKSTMDLQALSKKVAEHLGEYDSDGALKSPADLAKIKAFVQEEFDEFSAEAEAAMKLGEHAFFHEDLGFIDRRAVEPKHLNDVGIIASRAVK